jgi:phosphoribosyl-ATP pyrophosphohydrolase
MRREYGLDAAYDVSDAAVVAEMSPVAWHIAILLHYSKLQYNQAITCFGRRSCNNYK